MNQPDKKNDLPSQQELMDFLEMIFEKDQSDPSHLKNAAECYELLMQRKNDYVGTELEKAFWNSVSLECFHIAQGQAFTGETETALKHFESALEAATKGFSRSWEAYIRGTISYAKNDREGLRREIEPAQENAGVLGKLLKGLERRGSPDYQGDYSSPEESI